MNLGNARERFRLKLEVGRTVLDITSRQAKAGSLSTVG